jgi:hypothetical protein
LHSVVYLFHNPLYSRLATTPKYAFEEEVKNWGHKDFKQLCPAKDKIGHGMTYIEEVAKQRKVDGNS